MTETGSEEQGSSSHIRWALSSLSIAGGGGVTNSTPNYVAVGTGSALSYIRINSGEVLIGTEASPVSAPLSPGAGIGIYSSAGAISIYSTFAGINSLADYVAVGTGTFLTYVFVPTGQLLIGTGTRPVGAPLTAGTGIQITSSSGSITITATNSGLGGTPLDNYVAVGTGTSLTYVYVGTGQLIIGTGTRPVGAPVLAGTGIQITSSSGSITITATIADSEELLSITT